MAREGARPSYDPAGTDHALRAVLQELRTGRWVAMRTLLAETTEWWLWTQRTQILAAAAAGSDVVRAWLAEEPDSAHAGVMRARIGVERALRARRERHLRAHELWIEAWDAAETATLLAPRDPVPWICLLALAQLDPEQRWAEHRADPPEPHLVPGPWGLLAEAAERDPFNREAHHRMLQFLYARGGGGDRTGAPADDDSNRLTDAAGYARWAAAGAPPGSALHLLPLYVRVERHRRARRPDTHWATDAAVEEARSALHSWFEHAPPGRRAQPDLNHLAHALWGAGQFTCADRVFEAIGPYFGPPPWMYRVQNGDRAVDVFTRARDHCRALAGDAATGIRGKACAESCTEPRACTGTHP
ncbi:hypothetical protein ACFYMX_14805 [Streptomyces griseofuscus]|uniref:hypothetical protein n=1 Tax=Streptomyces TaxID=1883 RepID=UPI001F2AC675|nr:hypothetical protein [Streptomyces sp. CRPSP2-6A1]